MRSKWEDSKIRARYSLLYLIFQIGALFAWVSIFYGKSLYLDFRFPKEQKDRHYLVMQKYKETPWWWYGAIGVVAFVAGLVVCIRGNTDLNVGFYFLATFLGILLVPLNGSEI